MTYFVGYSEESGSQIIIVAKFSAEIKTKALPEPDKPKFKLKTC